MQLFNNYYQGRRVLVTGHTGFKGAWLSYWLTQMGANVTGYSLYIPSQPSMFEALNLQDKMEDVRGDIRDLDALVKLAETFQPEVVFHLAAQPVVMQAYSDPKETFDTNLGGTVNVLEMLRTIDSVKVAVLATSDKCYENVEWEYGYREEDALGGKDPYSASKACAEIAISSYCRSYFSDESSTRIASVRAGNVIGGGDWAASRIVPDCIRAWSRGEMVTIRSPNATRPWQHVLEPLSGYLHLAQCMSGDSSLSIQAYNFGPDAGVVQPVSALMTQMAKIWGDDAQCQADQNSSQLPAEAGLLKLCCDKALAKLRWTPTLQFSEVVVMTTAWYKQFYDDSSVVEEITKQQINSYIDMALRRERVWVQD